MKKVVIETAPTYEQASALVIWDYSTTVTLSVRRLMAAKDIFHDAVRHALEKDGWIITNDPLFIRFGGIDMYIDLGAERIIAAERGTQKIAVEIKSFIGPSETTEFSTALGQFLKYQLALEEEQPDRHLYLAVPQDTYRTFFSLELTRRLVERYKVSLIAYDPEEEVIVQWQP